MIKTLAYAAAGLMATTGAAFAVVNPSTNVPEIDALSGLAALAVVGAAVALVRERSK